MWMVCAGWQSYRTLDRAVLPEAEESEKEPRAGCWYSIRTRPQGKGEDGAGPQGSGPGN